MIKKLVLSEKRMYSQMRDSAFHSLQEFGRDVASQSLKMSFIVRNILKPVFSWAWNLRQLLTLFSFQIEQQMSTGQNGMRGMCRSHRMELLGELSSSDKSWYCFDCGLSFQKRLLSRCFFFKLWKTFLWRVILKHFCKSQYHDSCSVFELNVIVFDWVDQCVTEIQRHRKL